MADFSDTRALINSLQNYTGSLEKALESAIIAYNKISTDLDYAENRLQAKTKSNYPSTYAKAFVKAMKEGSTIVEILKNAITEATGVNEEFSIPAYLEPLLSVANDKDIYNIQLLGSGWNIKAKVIISFEETAGRLEDWARGISGYREALGVNLESGRGARATKYWFKRVYRTSLEADTVEGRLAYAGRPAPYWQILNSGSPSNLPSDRDDGSYNPVESVPTDFIGTAEALISQHFLNSIEAEKFLWENEIKLLKEEISEARNILLELSDLIDKLKADERLDQVIINVLNSRSKSGDIRDYVDRKKLREAVKRFRAGEDFTTSRIELTAKNAEGKRVRPRATTLIRILEGIEEL